MKYSFIAASLFFSGLACSNVIATQFEKVQYDDVLSGWGAYCEALNKGKDKDFSDENSIYCNLKGINGDTFGHNGDTISTRARNQIFQGGIEHPKLNWAFAELGNTHRKLQEQIDESKQKIASLEKGINELTVSLAKLGGHVGSVNPKYKAKKPTVISKKAASKPGQVY